MNTLFVDQGPTNKGLVVKETSYSSHWAGITEPQRRIVKALSSGRGNYLIEAETMKGRKVFRCHDMNRNIVGNRFSKVVVKNLVSKNYLVRIGQKYYLK